MEYPGPPEGSTLSFFIIAETTSSRTDESPIFSPSLILFAYPSAARSMSSLISTSTSLLALADSTLSSSHAICIPVGPPTLLRPRLRIRLLFAISFYSPFLLILTQCSRLPPIETQSPLFQELRKEFPRIGSGGGLSHAGCSIRR